MSNKTIDKKIKKAMILAAGKGKRMQELTINTPKPLLKIAGISMIVHHIQALKNSGIDEIVINIHYLKEQIKKALGDGSAYGVNIKYSDEDEILETGGGIYKALPLLGDAPFLVVSADLYTDFPFEKLLNYDLSNFYKSNQEILAHIVLVDNPEHNLNGDFSLDENGLVGLDKQNLLNMAGIGIYSPKLITEYLKNEQVAKLSNGDLKFQLGIVLKKAIEKKLVTGEHYNGLWYNVGTPSQLLEINDKIKNAGI